jgi:hypothetical protein
MKTKRTSKEKPAAAAPTPPTPEAEIREWAPELLTDLDVAAGPALKAPADGYGYRITAGGRTVCTIVVPRAVGWTNAGKLAQLLANAPELWQALRDCCPDCISGDYEGQKNFLRALRVLWNAADRYPFEIPLRHPDEAECFPRCNREVEKLLPAEPRSGGKAPAAV